MVDDGIMSLSNYKAMSARGKFTVVRRGGGASGQCALVSVDSLPTDYKSKVLELYPDGDKTRLAGWVRQNYEVDQAAVAFYHDRGQTGIDLSEDKVKEYVTNASVLNTCIKLYDRAATAQKLMGGKYNWDQMAATIESLREQFGHTLPSSTLRFRKKVAEYKRDGYGCLISGKFGNQSARKVDHKTERLMLGIAVLPNKPWNTSVWEMYNMFVCGELDVYDPETGELFSPDDFTDKTGEPKALSETTINNYLNKPKNRVLIDHALNSWTTFMHEQMPHVHRHAPEFSFSKVSFDDRDLPRKLKDTKARPKAYYAYDVASQCVVGFAYNRNKNTDLVVDCFRSMFRLMERNGWNCPAQVEVENHLMTQWKDSFLKAGVMFPFVRFCAPQNSQEKYAEQMNGAKKRSVEHKNHLGIGRFYAKSRQYRTEAKKVFDELNDTYEDKQYYSWDELIADDIGDVKNYTKEAVAGQTLPDIIKSWESTVATDSNLYSARKSVTEFLSKKNADTAQGKITFADGIEVKKGGSKKLEVTQTGVEVTGDAEVTGDVEASDDVKAGNNVEATEDVKAGNNVEATEDVKAGNNVEATEDVKAGNNVEATEAVKGKTMHTEEGMTFGTNYQADAQGAIIKQNQNGSWEIETDFLKIHKKLSATEVEIQKVSHIGGKLINTAASMVMTKVVTLTGYQYKTRTYTGSAIKCYAESVDSDGREVNNQWKRGDQAYCQTFNIQTSGQMANTYYWRLVEEAGTETDTNGKKWNFVVLSTQDAATGSTTPKAGDEIVLLGHRKQSTETDAEAAGRQGAIIQAAADSWTSGVVPYLRFYKGIGAGSYPFVLPNPFIQLSPTESWIDGSSIRMSADGESESMAERFAGIEEQLDESFQIWQEETAATPTLSNAPASSWTTATLKDEHVGDFYLNSEGKCWEFRKVNGVYGWSLVTDQYLTAYVEQIGEKARVYVQTTRPSAPYKKGDVWINGDDTYVCKQDNTTTTSQETDWRKLDYATKNYVGSEITNKGDEILAQTYRRGEEGQLITAAGLVTNATFATLFATNIDGHKAEITAAVKDGKSQIGMTADDILINAANAQIKLGDYFKLLNGITFIRDLTVEGCFNNLKTLVTETMLRRWGQAELYGFGESARGWDSCYSLDPLVIGTVVSLQGTMAAANTTAISKLALPAYSYTPEYGASQLNGAMYVRTNTFYGHEEAIAQPITLDQMRMLIGKVLYIYNDTTNMGVEMSVFYGEKMEERGDGTIVGQGAGMTGIPESGVLKFECKVGWKLINGTYQECIYWTHSVIGGSQLPDFDNLINDDE